MGPFSGVIFLAGVIMFFVGRNRNNDFMFSWRGSSGSDGEPGRIYFMLLGISLVVIAVVMWVYLAINGEPGPLPDYSSMMNRNSSQ